MATAAGHCGQSDPGPAFSADADDDTSKPSPTARVTSSADISHTIEAWDGAGGAAPVAARRLERTEHVRARSLDPGLAPSAPRRRRVDVRFANADLPNALRLLAEVARVQLVVGEGVDGTVSTTLRGVDPYSALVALAEAYGARVSSSDGIVVVRR